MKYIHGGIEVGIIARMRYRGRALLLGVAMLRKHGLRGFATPNHPKERVICVSTHLHPDKATFQEAVIHETLHIAFPKASERQIEESAHLVATVLRKYESAKRRAA